MGRGKQNDGFVDSAIWAWQRAGFVLALKTVRQRNQFLSPPVAKVMYRSIRIASWLFLFDVQPTQGNLWAADGCGDCGLGGVEGRREHLDLVSVGRENVGF